MSNADELIPVFVPALGTILLSAEDEKGAPLTNEEVIGIRDNAACMMMTIADANQLAESRGYRDLDPENCWYDWQMLRRELGRKPDLDPGARVNLLRSDDPAYLATIARAQETLDSFREMLPRFDASAALVKTELEDGTGRGFVWLFNTQIDGPDFTAELFEVPPSVAALRVGQSFRIRAEDVLDWMVNDDGSLHGGFSLRYHRETLEPHERDAFDAHIGVTNYVGQ